MLTLEVILRPWLAKYSRGEKRRPRKVRFLPEALDGRVKAHLSGDPADAHWAALNKSNQALAKTLSSLTDLYASDQSSYMEGVKFISSLQHVQVSFRGWTP